MNVEKFEALHFSTEEYPMIPYPTLHTLELVTFNRNAFWCHVLQPGLCRSMQVGAPLGAGLLLPSVGLTVQNSLRALSLALLFLIRANKPANHVTTASFKGDFP